MSSGDEKHGVGDSAGLCRSSEPGGKDAKLPSSPSRTEVLDAKVHEINVLHADSNVTRRSHKSTKKGLAYKLQTSQNTLNTLSKRLYRQIDLLTELISSTTQRPNIDVVNRDLERVENTRFLVD